MLDELLDELRSPVVFVYASVLLTWCLVSSTQIGGSVEFEFKAFRLQHYDLAGTPHGSRTWKVMFEAVSLESTALRRCMIVHWQDLLGRDLKVIFNQAAGAVLIVLPANLDSLSQTSRAKFAIFERNLLSLTTELAVFVTHQQPEVQALLTGFTSFPTKQVLHIDSENLMSATAMQQIINTIAANTFQLSSMSSVSNGLVTPKLSNIVGRLWSSDRSVPTIVFVAHYDTHSAVPALSIGADSNGSGVAALLELLAMFSRFFATATTKPRYNLIFILSAGGKFSYQGSRQWLEDHLEKQNEMNIELVVCLDSLGIDKGLFVHVSKMPSELSSVGRMYSRLKEASPVDREVEIVSKKISLNADLLAWEHERYSIRRLPALTISHFKSHIDPFRNSILDTPLQIEMNVLEANVRMIGEAVWAYILNLPNTNCSHANNASTCSILSENGISAKRLANWITHFASEPRPNAGDNAWLIANLRDTVFRYTSGQTVVEPVSLIDVTLYGVLEDHLTAHRAKPAIFELLLAVVISIYLTATYFIALNLQSSIEIALVKLKKS